jgi:hypothetical protein
MQPVENTSHIAAWYYCQQGKTSHFNPNFGAGNIIHCSAIGRFEFFVSLKINPGE